MAHAMTPSRQNILITWALYQAVFSRLQIQPDSRRPPSQPSPIQTRLHMAHIYIMVVFVVCEVQQQHALAGVEVLHYTSRHACAHARAKLYSSRARMHTQTHNHEGWAGVSPRLADDETLGDGGNPRHRRVPPI